MAYKIAVLSGKGGTGKTTVSLLLHHSLGEFSGVLADCDVEAPNDYLFMQEPLKIEEKEVYRLVPSILKDQCNYCGKCRDYCEFNAIVVLPDYEFAQVNTELCHSCGACLEACSQNAIIEYAESIGAISKYTGVAPENLTEGKLKVGSSMQSMMIRELKLDLPSDCDYIILDSPPGSDCSVVETARDADFVILVAEPTLFGLHDLKLVIELVRTLDIPHAVVINKSRGSNHPLTSYLQAEKIPILAEIPFDRKFAQNYAKGSIFGKKSDSLAVAIDKILKPLKERILQYEGDHYFKW